MRLFVTNVIFVCFFFFLLLYCFLGGIIFVRIYLNQDVAKIVFIPPFCYNSSALYDFCSHIQKSSKMAATVPPGALADLLLFYIVLIIIHSLL